MYNVSIKHKFESSVLLSSVQLQDKFTVFSATYKNTDPI